MIRLFHRSAAGSQSFRSILLQRLYGFRDCPEAPAPCARSCIVGVQEAADAVFAAADAANDHIFDDQRRYGNAVAAAWSATFTSHSTEPVLASSATRCASTVPTKRRSPRIATPRFT